MEKVIVEINGLHFKNNAEIIWNLKGFLFMYLFLA